MLAVPLEGRVTAGGDDFDLRMLWEDASYIGLPEGKRYAMYRAALAALRASDLSDQADEIKDNARKSGAASLYLVVPHNPLRNSHLHTEKPIVDDDIDVFPRRTDAGAGNGFDRASRQSEAVVRDAMPALAPEVRAYREAVVEFGPSSEDAKRLAERVDRMMASTLTALLTANRAQALGRGGRRR